MYHMAAGGTLLVAFVCWLKLVVAVDGLTVTGDPWVDIHQNATVTCSAFMAQLLLVNWRESPLGALQSVSEPILLYDTYPVIHVTWSETVDRTHFLFDETKTDFPLTILSVTLDDEGRYWCQAFDNVTFYTSTEQTEIRIRVSPLVYVSNAPWVDIGLDTTLNCSTTFTGTVRAAQWKRGEVTDSSNDAIAIVLLVVGKAIYWGDAVDTSHLTFDETVPGVPLTIISATLGDEGRYWCMLNVLEIGEEIGSSDLQIRVPPTTMTIMYGGNSYSNRDSISVIARDNRQFTCTVPGVKPAVNLTWTLDGATLQQTGSQEDTDNPDDPRLVDSSDTEAVDIAESPGTQTLSCGATNRQDGLTDAELTVTVTVLVKVPPSTSSMTLSTSTGSLVPGAKVTVEQGIEHTFMCVVQGTRPSVTITWLLQDRVRKTDAPDPAGGDELVETRSDWSFIPSRDDHDSEVECSASTTETEDPAPSVFVTLEVNGPPDAPIIAGSTSMVENGPYDLICTAEGGGYPGDWSLVWFNEDTPLPNPATTSSPSGNRFSFSSTLTFRPAREDNGRSIKCKAERGSFASAEGTFGPLNVQFLPRSTTVKQCPMKTQQGSQLELVCSSESSNPAASLSWLKNEQVETNDQGSSRELDGIFNGKVTEQTYFQPFTNKADNGAKFKCCVTTDLTTCSGTCTLNVEYPPEFRRLASPDVVVTEGGDVDLSCSADANPRPPDFITWERVSSSSQTLPSMYTDGMSNVTLSDITRDQAGPYRCRGNNGIPPVVFSSQVVVKVHYEVFFINKEDLTVGAKDGATALLRCTAMGNPLPLTHWTSEAHTGTITNQTQSDKLSVAHTTIGGDDVYGYNVASTLEIKDVVGRSDYGFYTCQSGNGIGMVVSLDIELNDRVRPQPPTSVTIDQDQISATSVKVVWTPGNDGGETQWFHVNYRDVQTSEDFDPTKLSKRLDDVTEYLIERLSPYSLYEIQVYAENVNGISRSVKRNVTTLPLNPEKMGIDVTLRQATGTISLENIPQDDDGCLRLEFRLSEQDEWYDYGDCQETNTNLMLEELRSRFCQGSPNSLCSEPSRADVDTSRGDVGLIAGLIILILILLVIVVVFLILIFYRRRSNLMDKQSLLSKQKRKPEMEYQELDIPMQIVSGPSVAKRPAPVPTYDEVPEVDIVTAVPRDRVNITKPLGEGAFGRVLLGRVRSIVRRGVVTDVAIKTLKDGAGPTQKDDLLRELDLMKSLPTHKNVVKLLGFCVETEPIYIIVEFLSKGNLKDLLTESRGKGKAKLQIYGNLHGSSKNLTSRDLIAIGRDAADGMAFLSEQECIHRDLAARNILVSKNMVCKVADFGLARDIKDERVYHRKSETPLPIRWMALESIFDDVYTTKSDVWSFGILLWEIVTLGARPYPSMGAKTVTSEIRIGYRMPRPEHCQDELYQMMLNCWSEDPDDRLHFQKLSTKLGKLLETASDYISLTDYQETLYEVTIPSTSDEKI